MEIIDINRNTLANLYEQFPESFKGLELKGNDLIYGNESIDISKFNINDLLSDTTQFAASLSVLSAEDIFRIIRIHAMMINSNLDKENTSLNEKRVEIIKQENPLMKNISIVRKKTEVGYSEYFNIVDSYGTDHLFRNDRNVNVFDIYEELKITSHGSDVTPDQLIAAINRKLYSVDIEKADSLASKEATSEDFANKINRVNAPYKDDKMHDVLGNEQDDIAIVSDLSSPTEHQVVTFDKNEFGDLVLQNHSQNVNGTDTVLGEEVTGNMESSVSDNKTTDVQVDFNRNDEVVSELISAREFYALLNSSEELTEEQRKNVQLYYAYLGELIYYEDYLLAELRSVLSEFRNYVYELEFGEHMVAINEKQQNAIDKNYELEQKKVENVNAISPEKAQEEVKKLQLLLPKNNDNTGSVATIQVIAFIVGIAIILTAITLYLIG